MDGRDKADTFAWNLVAYFGLVNNSVMRCEMDAEVYQHVRWVILIVIQLRASFWPLGPNEFSLN